ncbi:hypothetical protein EPVG_00052 [Emiliania huxleyi virus 201]|nr:hypothetical protein ELVG_00222 [Emiliania huxleyi virus 203]AEP15598.1 hypothetical protein EQVG_00188 [Emiliania huxleyi virus 207]AEP16016.1 hypothetical protein ERVG_00139 [Emiliania huxleyi virus 208]AET97940.1 hypothetical protein EPVG_00052 [Emiliania huxleyi virus 201]
MIFSDKTLKHLLIWNFIAGTCNLAMAIVTGVVGNLNLRPDLYNVQAEFTGMTDAYMLAPTNHVYGTFPITALMMATFIISAVFNYGNIMLWPNAYYSKLEKGCSPFRWTDVFFSTTLLTGCVAFASGMRDLNQLVLVSGLSVTVTSLLYLTDVYLKPKDDVDAWKEESFVMRAKPHLISVIPFTFMWVMLFMTFLNGPSCVAPNWLWATFILFFILSIANFLPQVYQVAMPPSLYVKGEFKYITLTTFTKVLIGILLVSSALGKTDFNSAVVKSDPSGCLAYPPPPWSPPSPPLPPPPSTSPSPPPGSP